MSMPEAAPWRPYIDLELQVYFGVGGEGLAKITCR